MDGGSCRVERQQEIKSETITGTAALRANQVRFLRRRREENGFAQPNFTINGSACQGNES